METSSLLAFAALVLSALACGAEGEDDEVQDQPCATQDESYADVKTDPAETRPPGVLLDSRDCLAICVDWIPPGDQEADSDAPEQAEAVAAVKAALPILAEHEVWQKVKLSAPPPPVVMADCPRGPAIYDEEAGSVPGLPESFFNAPGYTVTTASPYQVHLFVIAASDVDRLGGRSWRTTTEESRCSGHECHGVTTGLYVSAAEIRNQELLVSAVARAIGLE